LVWIPILIKVFSRFIGVYGASIATSKKVTGSYPATSLKGNGIGFGYHHWKIKKGLRQFYALPSALSTLSGMSGGAIHLPIALATAQTISCVVAIEWLMPEAP
jgi:hypothetical protein